MYFRTRSIHAVLTKSLNLTVLDSRSICIKYLIQCIWVICLLNIFNEVITIQDITCFSKTCSTTINTLKHYCMKSFISIQIQIRVFSTLINYFILRKYLFISIFFTCHYVYYFIIKGLCKRR